MWSQKVSRYLHYITAANVGHNVFVMISSAWALNQTASVILLYYYLVRKILLWSWEGRTPENSGMRLYLFIWQSSLYNAIEIYKIINQNRVSLLVNSVDYSEIQITKALLEIYWHIAFSFIMNLRLKANICFIWLVLIPRPWNLNLCTCGFRVSNTRYGIPSSA